MALTELLEFLQEIEHRKLYLMRGFESLFTFLVKGLGYEEGSAYRRLQTLRALNSTPEIKDHLARGSLTLTNIAAAQGLIQALEKNRPVPTEEKCAFFREVQNQSKRGAEQILLSRAEKEGVTLKGVTAAADLIRATSPAKVEIRFQAAREFEEKLKRLRELYFKKSPGASLEELLTWAVEETLNRHDPIRRDARAQARESRGIRAREKAVARRVQRATSATSAAPIPDHESRERETQAPAPQFPNAEPSTQSPPTLQISPTQSPPQFSPTPQRSSPHSSSIPTPYRPHLPAATRRLVRQRGEFRCEYRDSQTGRRCEETKTLEIDHQVPLIFGGSSTPENLQILCRAHHRAKGLSGHPRASQANHPLMANGKFS